MTLCAWQLPYLHSIFRTVPKVADIDHRTAAAVLGGNHRQYQ
jgi:hypothetical protein